MAVGFAPVDVEAALVSYLSGAVGVRVVTTIPNPHPGRLVRVGRIGGLRANLVQEKPLVLIECWDTTEPAAYGLMQDVYAALTAAVQTWITDDVWLYRLELSGGVNYPDPSTNGSRYQLTASLWTRFGVRS